MFQQTEHLHPNIIGIKRLYLDMKSITDRVANGEEFIVVKNTKPVFKITYLEMSKKEKKYSLQDFAKAQFSCNDKNLSKNIDKLLYN